MRRRTAIWVTSSDVYKRQLLGTGGLVRAYTAAAGGALQSAELVSMRLVVDCRLRVPYAQFEQAQRIIAAAGAKPEEPRCV